jgi:hypothetical protein
MQNFKHINHIKHIEPSPKQKISNGVAILSHVGAWCCGVEIKESPPSYSVQVHWVPEIYTRSKNDKF